MNSSAWTNGQYHHPGQQSQSSQVTSQAAGDNMRNQNAGTVHYASQYGRLNTWVQPQNHTIHHKGVSSNGQPSNLQSTNVYQYRTLSQQPATAAKQNNFVLGVVVGYQQNPLAIAQSGNLALPVHLNYGSQGGAKQTFHPNILRKALIQSKSSMMKTNTSNAVQHQPFPAVRPPSYNAAVSQMGRNCSRSNVTTNPSTGQLLPTSSMDQRTCGYRTGAATSSTVNSQTSPKGVQNVFSKASQPSVVPVANSQQQITVFTNKLFQSVGCAESQLVAKSPSYGGNQLISMLRMDSSQALQSGTLNVIRSYNSNASQAIFLQPLPKTTHGSTSTTLHSVDAQSQQSSPPKAFHIPASAAPSGNYLKGGNVASVPNEIIIASVVSESQTQQLSQNIPMQRNSAQSSGEHIKGQKAVAVVQPLSSSQVANSLQCEPTNPEKSLVSLTGVKTSTNLTDGANPLKQDVRIHKELSKDSKFRKFFHGKSTPSNDCSVASSGSTEPEDLLRKQFCAAGTESKLSTEGQHIAPTAEKSQIDKTPPSPNGELNTRRTPTDPDTCVHDFSSVQTVQWTVAKLAKLIEGATAAQTKLENVANFNNASKVLNLFWGSNCNNLACKLKAGWYRDLMKEVKEFCSEHTKSDTVILSQVKRGFWDKLQQSCFVLKPDDVYREEPYTSSWLNVNEQVDDIDKEFGPPLCLRYRIQSFESDRQPDPVENVSRNPAETVNERLSTQTVVEKGDCATEESIVVETSRECPIETESSSSVDSYYSFQIQVLPPEEAKVIFEQGPQKKAADDQPAEVLKASEDKLPEITEETGAKPAIEEFCCVARFMEMLEHGSNSQCKCQCKGGPSQEDSAEKVLHKDKEKVQKKENLDQNKSDGKLHCVVEDNETADNLLKVFNWPEFSSEFGNTIDLTVDDAVIPSCPDNEAESITVLSEGDGQSSIILLSESEDETLTGSETEVPNEVENPKEALAHGELEPKRTTQQSSDDETETEDSSEDDVGKGSSDVEGAELKSADVSQKQLESQEQTQNGATTKGGCQRTLSLTSNRRTPGIKRKRLRSPERFFSFLKNLKKAKPAVKDDSQDVIDGTSKCRRVSVDDPGGASLMTKGRTVELALFGSVPQEDDVLQVGRRSQVSSLELFRDHGPKPPEVISVNLNPLPKKCSETSLRPSPYSIKQRTYGKWKTLSPIKIKYRRKFQTQNCSSEVGDEKVGQSCTKERSDRRCLSGKRRHRLSLKRIRSPYTSPKLGSEKGKKEAFALKQPAERVGRDPGNRRLAVLPLQEENVLIFSVLPNTFNFKDGPNERNNTAVPETSSSPLEKPDLQVEDKSSNLPAKMSRGRWAPTPEKKSHTRRTMDHKTASVFHEFQKKYMKKRPPIQ